MFVYHDMVLFGDEVFFIHPPSIKRHKTIIASIDANYEGFQINNKSRLFTSHLNSNTAQR